MIDCEADVQRPPRAAKQAGLLDTGLAPGDDASVTGATCDSASPSATAMMMSKTPTTDVTTVLADLPEDGATTMGAWTLDSDAVGSSGQNATAVPEIKIS